MVNINNFYFLKNVSSAMESNPTINVDGDVLCIEVEGTASSCEIEVLIGSDRVSDGYYPITGIDPQFNLVENITKNGCYIYGIEGYSRIKVNLKSVSGGDISIFGKIIKEGV